MVIDFYLNVKLNYFTVLIYNLVSFMYTTNSKHKTYYARIIILKYANIFKYNTFTSIQVHSTLVFSSKTKEYLHNS